MWSKPRNEENGTVDAALNTEFFAVTKCTGPAKLVIYRNMCVNDNMYRKAYKGCPTGSWCLMSCVRKAFCNWLFWRKVTHESYSLFSAQIMGPSSLPCITFSSLMLCGHVFFLHSGQTSLRTLNKCPIHSAPFSPSTLILASKYYSLVSESGGVCSKMAHLTCTVAGFFPCFC